MDTCRIHGQTNIKLISNGKGRKKRQSCVVCLHARQQKVRKRKKKLLVDAAGKCCVSCKYRRWLCALDFHHIDPAQKEFAISKMGSFSLERCVQEALKCILLCKNCHTEYETGYGPTVKKVNKIIKMRLKSPVSED